MAPIYKYLFTLDGYLCHYIMFMEICNTYYLLFMTKYIWNLIPEPETSCLLLHVSYCVRRTWSQLWIEIVRWQRCSGTSTGFTSPRFVRQNHAGYRKWGPNDLRRCGSWKVWGCNTLPHLPIRVATSNMPSMQNDSNCQSSFIIYGAMMPIW